MAWRSLRRLIGAYVRIDAPGDTLVVAEGLETALSARRALGAGAWAFLSAENLAQFEPPPVIDRLIVAADNDKAGLAAAARIRARAEGSIACEVALPPGGYSDWNDWARAEARYPSRTAFEDRPRLTQAYRGIAQGRDRA